MLYVSKIREFTLETDRFFVSLYLSDGHYRVKGERRAKPGRIKCYNMNNTERKQ